MPCRCPRSLPLTSSSSHLRPFLGSTIWRRPPPPPLAPPRSVVGGRGSAGRGGCLRERGGLCGGRRMRSGCLRSGRRVRLQDGGSLRGGRTGGVSAGGVVVCGKGRGVPPFLRLRAVFGCVRPGVIRSTRRVKRHYVDGRRREHCQIQIVRNYPLVIFREPPLQGNSLGVFAETLIGLIPMEDKRLETHSHTHTPRNANAFSLGLAGSNNTTSLVSH